MPLSLRNRPFGAGRSLGLGSGGDLGFLPCGCGGCSTRVAARAPCGARSQGWRRRIDAKATGLRCPFALLDPAKLMYPGSRGLSARRADDRRAPRGRRRISLAHLIHQAGRGWPVNLALG
jgi:hypothetical protein